ncbi:MAG: replication factor C large subunit [Candidatus Micrarchaeota archaeon]|nr:replication factor C large subunit [Candidatus Micrarchaeota archaeon]
MLLSEKYSPKDIDGLLVRNDVKAKLREFEDAINKGHRVKPLLIYGPSGTGKSAAIHAMASSNGYRLIEFNASDYRDSETLRKRIVPSTSSRSLFNEKILIFFDEIDEMSSKYDSGADKVILSMIKGSRQPIVLIANDYWSKKIAFLRNQTDKLEFKRIPLPDMFKFLSAIAANEGSKLEQTTIKEIASRSNGDIRGALNDLDAIMHSGPELMEYIGLRNRKVEVFKVLDKIFTSNSFDLARGATINIDIELDMLMNWIDQNIPAKYLSKKGIMDSYEQLSRASMFLEKASRDNYYGYLRYSSVIMSSGISISSDGMVSTMAVYTFPSKITYLSRTKKNRDMLGTAAHTLSPLVHTSRKQIINAYLPLLKRIVAYYKAGMPADEVMDMVSRSSNIEKEDLEELLNYYSLA